MQEQPPAERCGSQAHHILRNTGLWRTYKRPGERRVKELENDRFLRALLREPVDMTPVWMMRQAGRYLPEYRATRSKAGSFMDLCRNPELACEVTLQPLERFPLDAAILFSDILTIPDAMGLGLYFTEGEGPRFRHPVKDEAAVRDLGVPDPETDLGYVMDAVRTIRRELDGRVPLIGFSGSPWTLATYMVEGSGTKNFAGVKGMMFGRPDLLHQLLSKIAEAVILYLNAQIAAGAQAVMIFDTWGGVLSPRDYRDFSLAEASGCSRRQPPVVTPWASIGPPIWPMPAGRWGTGLPSRVISIPVSSMPPRSGFARVSLKSWPAMAKDPAMSLIWGTASILM